MLGLGLIAGALIAQQIARPIRRLDDRRRPGGGAATSTRGRRSRAAPSSARSLASFNEMTERVSRLLRSQRDFVADASHQLRTPLTGLRLQLEEVRDATPDSDPRAQRLDAGMSEVDRLSQIVDELLVLSRAGEHELPGSEDRSRARRPTGPLERWQKAADDAGIELVRGTGRGRVDGLVHGRRPRPRARRADRERDPLLAAPESRRHDRRLAADGIEVLDRGPGLESGEEEAVFERFHRGRAGRQGVTGTGLGLPIARELVEQWGGSVTIANREERGARA